MSDLAKRLSGPALLTASAATVYTVPASTTAVVRNIHFANTSASAVAVNLSIGVDGAGTRFYSGLSIPANSAFDWSGFLVLAAGEVLQAFAGTTNVVALTVAGVETI